MNSYINKGLRKQTKYVRNKSHTWKPFVCIWDLESFNTAQKSGGFSNDFGFRKVSADSTT